MMTPQERMECREAINEGKRIVEMGTLEDTKVVSYPYVRSFKILRILFSPFKKVWHCLECDYLTGSSIIFMFHSFRHVIQASYKCSKEKPYFRQWVEEYYELPEEVKED